MMFFFFFHATLVDLAEKVHTVLHMDFPTDWKHQNFARVSVVWNYDYRDHGDSCSITASCALYELEYVKAPTSVLFQVETDLCLTLEI